MSCPCSHNTPYRMTPIASLNSQNKSNGEHSHRSNQQRTCKCSSHGSSRSRSNSVGDANGRRQSCDAEDNGSLTAPCRCSQLCYRSKSRQGCTDESQQNIYGSRSRNNSKENRRLSSDMKDNRSNNSLTESCPCSKSQTCYRSRSHKRSAAEDQAPSNRRSNGDLKKNGSGSVHSCACMRMSRRTPNQDEYFGNGSRTTSCSSMRRSRSSSLESCPCDNRSTYQNYSHPYATAIPNYPFSNNQFGNSCMCYTLTNEVPVKGPRSNAEPDIEDCLCKVKSLQNNQMSTFSLDSTDLKYLEKVRQLTQQDCNLKKELDNLATQETAIRNSLKPTDQPQSSLPQGANGSSGNKGPDNIRMLRGLNKELQSLNETLCDRIQDLRLERDQLAQKIEGPLNRELDRIRKKFIQTQSDLSAKSQPEYVDTSSDELDLVKSQLARTQENIGDIALVNDGIKQEVLVLEYKCSQMEQVLIQQKMNEINTINKLQADDISCSCSQISSTETTCSCNDNP